MTYPILLLIQKLTNLFVLKFKKALGNNAISDLYLGVTSGVNVFSPFYAVEKMSLFK